MNCAVCQGACCEEFAIKTIDLRGGLPSEDVIQWVWLHGVVPTNDPLWVRFECRCTKLTTSGLCSIYEQRPETCRTYAPGSAACLDTIRRRRTPEQAAAIGVGGESISGA